MLSRPVASLCLLQILFPTIILQSGTPPGATPLLRLPQGPNQGRGEDVLLLVGSVPRTESQVSSSARKSVPGFFGGPVTAQSLASQNAEVFRRGYALVVFNPTDCAEDTTLRNLDGSWAFRNTRFYPAYPGFDWGILAGWAWGLPALPTIWRMILPLIKPNSLLPGLRETGNQQ